MRKFLFVFLLFSTLGIQSSAGQSTNVGLDAMYHLKDGWLIVRLPAFAKKIETIDSLLNLELSERNRGRLESLRDEAVGDQRVIQTWYPIAFDSLYTFSKCAFIAMHETEDFQAGQLSARAADGTPVPGLHNAYYLFGTLQGVEGGRFEFTFPDHSEVQSPLPAYIAMSGPLLPGILNLPKSTWMRELEDEPGRVYRIYSHVSRINRILNKLYQRKVIASAYQAGTPTDH